MRNSRARSLLTWRIHDRWLWEKPWMNRISGPDGLPHSCAEMVRPSGVFTLIGLCFGCCPRPGCAIATRNAATVNLAKRLPSKDIVIAHPPNGISTATRATRGAGNTHGVAHRHGADARALAYESVVHRPDEPSPRNDDGRVSV